ALFLCFYESWDFDVYCQTGRAMVEGTDPYASSLSQYPINALPLFGLFALMPSGAASSLWYAFNIAALLLAIRFGQLIRLRRASPEPCDPWHSDAYVILAVLLAGATTWALDAGQLVAWTTLWVYAAVHGHFRGRQVSSGLALAAGSLKITTSLPFLWLPVARG